jgi:hypothetical protein
MTTLLAARVQRCKDTRRRLYPYSYHRVLSAAGNCKYRLLDLCFGVVAGLFQLNMREVGQFVSRNHAVDNGRAIRLQRLVDGIAQLARLSGPGSP